MKTLEKKQKGIWTKPIVVACVAILCCALWGSAFPAIKIGYQCFGIESHESATQILFAGCRFTMAGILTILIGSVLSGSFIKPKKTSWKKIIVLSCFQTSVHYTCFYIGLAHTTGVKSSILNGMNVFLAIFIAAILFRQEKLTTVKVLGSMLGFAGILLVNLSEQGLDFDFHLMGEGMIVLSSVCYGMSSALIRVYGKNENSVMLSGYQFAFGGMIMILIGWMLGGRLDTWKGQGIAILVYLAFVSAVAYTLWAILLRYNDVSKVAIYGCFNPIFGALLSATLLQETEQTFGVKEVIALCLVSIGILIVQGKKGKHTSVNEV